MEQIYLLFDFKNENYIGPDPGEINRLVVGLTVANDYYIEVFLNGVPEWNVSALRNVKDLSNKTDLLVEIVRKAEDTSIEAQSWARLKSSEGLTSPKFSTLARRQ